MNAPNIKASRIICLALLFCEAAMVEFGKLSYPRSNLSEEFDAPKSGMPPVGDCTEKWNIVIFLLLKKF